MLDSNIKNSGESFTPRCDSTWGQAADCCTKEVEKRKILWWVFSSHLVWPQYRDRNSKQGPKELTLVAGSGSCDFTIFAMAWYFRQNEPRLKVRVTELRRGGTWFGGVRSQEMMSKFDHPRWLARWSTGKALSNFEGQQLSDRCYRARPGQTSRCGWLCEVVVSGGWFL